MAQRRMSSPTLFPRRVSISLPPQPAVGKLAPLYDVAEESDESGDETVLQTTSAILGCKKDDTKATSCTCYSNEYLNFLRAMEMVAFNMIYKIIDKISSRKHQMK